MCARNDGRRRRFRSAPTPTPLKSRNECGTSAGSTRFWVCDISYLRTLEGWLYLATVIDAHSRRVIGWAVDEHMRADLVEDALRMAITMRGELTEKVTFHTDRGTQPGFKTRSSRSPTRTGSPARWVTPECAWDIAMAELFFAALKTGFYYRRVWPTKTPSRIEVGKWIEDRYNRRRRHASLGEVSPVAFEDAILTCSD